jgi:molybdate transport system regulatory protein
MITADLILRASVWLERGGTYLVGDAEARLLEAIDRTGSIKGAAKVAGLSYRTAWARMRQLERALGTPAVRSRAGGPRGGESFLTDDARLLLKRHADLRRRVGELLAQATTPTP